MEMFIYGTIHLFLAYFFVNLMLKTENEKTVKICFWVLLFVHPFFLMRLRNHYKTKQNNKKNE